MHSILVYYALFLLSVLLAFGLWVFTKFFVNPRNLPRSSNNPASSDNRLASRFVRYSLAAQQNLARGVLPSIESNKIYVYDQCNFFHDATSVVIGTTRVLRKDGKYAVNSVAAQAIFRSINTYLQYSSPSDLRIDEIGVFIPSSSDP